MQKKASKRIMAILLSGILAQSMVLCSGSDSVYAEDIYSIPRCCCMLEL